MTSTSDSLITTKTSLELDPKLESALQKILHELYQIHLSDSKKMADCILKLSDFYIQNPMKETPWNEKWCQIAYLSYYLPLNFIRAKRAINQGHAFRFFDQFENIYDFGSGLGSATLFLMDHSFSFTNIETSDVATQLHRELLKHLKIDLAKIKWESHGPQTVLTKSLAVFSYSLTEQQQLPAWVQRCDGLFITEPATQSQGRKLLELRENLIQNKFFIWAPCTHQGRCPLLYQSAKDWCHDRVHFKSPQWMLDVENFLPLRNRTLPFSFIMASKNPPPLLTEKPLARLVGDSLEEKGKTRQLVCHNEEREFLTWMHKKTAPQTLDRGELILWPSEFEKKSNEIRVSSLIKYFE